MNTWPKYPVIYEINTWVWLGELSRKYGKSVDLATVPEQEWDAIASHGFDAVWFMGVWERSPAGIEISMRNQGLARGFPASPSRLHGGGQRRLAVLRAPLRRRRAPRRAEGARRRATHAPRARAAADPRFRAQSRGAGPSVGRRASRVLRSGERGRCPERSGVVRRGGRNGVRPRPGSLLPGVARRAPAQRLPAGAPAGGDRDDRRRSPRQCDGIRCDMAMLMLNDDLRAHLGGARRSQAGRRLLDDGDPGDQGEAAGVQVHRRGLLGPGVGTAAAGLRLLLRQEALRPDGARATPRACASTCWPIVPTRTGWSGSSRTTTSPGPPPRFPAGKARAAAVAILTLPGAKLLHEGQFEGRKVRLPVFLGRRPAEPVDQDLVGVLRAPAEGDRPRRLPERRMASLRAERLARQPELPEHPGLVLGQGRRALPRRRQFRGQAPPRRASTCRGMSCRGRQWRLDDALSGESYDRSGDEMRDAGLYVDLGPWQCHVFQVSASGTMFGTAPGGRAVPAGNDQARKQRMPKQGGVPV